MKRLLTALIALLTGGCINPNPPGKPQNPDNFAAIFYGDGDALTSGGMDRIRDELKRRGYDARTYRHVDVARAVADCGTRPRIVAAGNSFGGRAALDFASAQAAAGRRVGAIALLDGSEPGVPGGGFTTARPLSVPIPSNVGAALVICNPSTPILNSKPCPRVAWEPTTRVTVQTTTVFHTQIDDDRRIQDATVQFLETQ